MCEAKVKAMALHISSTPPMEKRALGCKFVEVCNQMIPWFLQVMDNMNKALKKLKPICL